MTLKIFNPFWLKFNSLPPMHIFKWITPLHGEGEQVTYYTTKEEVELQFYLLQY